MLGGGDIRRMVMDLVVVDADGEDIGLVTDTWPGDGGGEPELVRVGVGIKFPRPYFVPIRDAEIHGECLHVPWTKLEIEESPPADDERWGDPGSVARAYWSSQRDD
jgi:hypothetical protein